ncbi:MAG TPA: hypothetical protein VG734_18130 [Lacunisphaera sp.]|nr:hypothetical protein [Lacunisphaera sp.]
MKALNEVDLGEILGGAPSAETTLAYDIFYGLGAIAGAICSFFTAPMPPGWYRGLDGSCPYDV